MSEFDEKVNRKRCESYENNFLALKKSKMDKTVAKVELVESSRRPGGMQLVNTYRTNRTTDPMDLVELARQLQTADEFIRAGVSNKLTVIADQMRYLQEQARKVLLSAKQDYELHHVACNFKKQPGHTYHLYQRDSGQKYLSMLSPEEWGPGCPHKYFGSYHLERDMSWNSLDAVQSHDLSMVRILSDSESSIQEMLNDYDKFGTIRTN